MKKNAITTILFLLALGACRTSLRVQDSTQPTPENAQEIITYYLPKTLLKISIPIEKNERKAGLIDRLTASEQSLQYAYLLENYGWEKVEVEDKFSLGDKIQFIPLTVPDPKKQFTITGKTSRSIEQTLGVSLTKDGLISSGEFAQNDKTYEYVTKGVELLATTAAKFYGLGKNNPGPQPAVAGSPAFNRITKLLAELETLTETKAALIKNPTNAVNTSEPTKFRLDLIDSRIKSIKDEILGKIKTTVINLSLIYEPRNKSEDLTLLKIDPATGYEIPEAVAGLPVPEGATKVTSKYKELKIRPSVSNPLPQPRKEFKDSKSFGSEHFLVYNVPVKYTLELLYDGKQLKSFVSADDEKGTGTYDIWFPQKGHMAALPYGFKELKAVFFEDIGAIKEIKYAKAANLDAATITSGITALDSVISFRNKYKESKKEKPVVEEKEETKEQVIRLIIDKPAS